MSAMGWFYLLQWAKSLKGNHTFCEKPDRNALFIFYSGPKLILIFLKNLLKFFLNVFRLRIPRYLLYIVLCVTAKFVHLLQSFSPWFLWGRELWMAGRILNVRWWLRKLPIALDSITRDLSESNDSCFF